MVLSRQEHGVWFLILADLDIQLVSVTAAI